MKLYNKKNKKSMPFIQVWC